MPLRASYAPPHKRIATAQGNTSKPISYLMSWHGGIHMASSEPVRAIADGEVVFV